MKPMRITLWATPVVTLPNHCSLLVCVLRTSNDVSQYYPAITHLVDHSLWWIWTELREKDKIENEEQMWNKLQLKQRMFSLGSLTWTLVDKLLFMKWGCYFNLCYTTLCKQSLLVMMVLTHLNSLLSRQSFYMLTITSTKTIQCLAKYCWKCNDSGDLVLKRI